MKILTAAAAKLLDVTPATVRHMNERGDLPAAERIGGVRVFDRSLVLRVARLRAHRQRRQPSSPRADRRLAG